jgi:hypothetical protein
MYSNNNSFSSLSNWARLFKILDKVVHWIRLSTGQLLIQWTASQWLKLVDQKQRQWLDSYPLDNILSCGQLPWFFCTSSSKAIQAKNLKKGLLRSATFQVIFHTVQFICYDLQMIYDQSSCYLCVGAGNLCLHGIFSSHMVIKFLLDKL